MPVPKIPHASGEVIQPLPQEHILEHIDQQIGDVPLPRVIVKTISHGRACAAGLDQGINLVVLRSTPRGRR